MRRRRRITPFAAGAVALVIIALFAYGAYTKFANPFASHYTLHATFAGANGVQIGAPVRIAGVDVGTVTGISLEPGCSAARSTQSACQAADVTMTIENQGLPIHDDATFAIRPRTFLEGNFFVDVSPGTPAAPVAGNGHTFPVQQGIEDVQLDQVLTGLQQNTRQNLQTLLQQYGTAVEQGGPSFNASIRYWLPAYEYTSIVAHDALGLQTDDLSRYLAAQASVAAALDFHPQNLESVISDFNTTAGAFARQSRALQAAVSELPHTLSAAIPAFDALNAAFPPLRELARTLIPGIKSTGPTIDASLPFITQLNDLVAPSELRGLTADLRGTVPSLAALANDTIPLMAKQVRPAASCVANVIYPWSQLTVPDSTFTAADGFPPRKVYQEAVDYLPGLAGESRDFDANGPYIRIVGPGGPLTYSMSPGYYGQSLFSIEGVQPMLPPGGKRPPYEETVPCETQPAITSLAAASGPGPTAISTSLSAPGASARWKGVIANALPMLQSLAKAAGVGLSDNAAKAFASAGGSAR